MGLLQKAVDFLSNMWDEDGNKVRINVNSITDSYNDLMMYKYALHVAASRIAAIISKCEFKTYAKNKEIKESNWYSFNVKPNANQTASEFKRQIINELILSEKNECLIIVKNINGKASFFVASDFKSNRSITSEQVFSDVKVNLYGEEEQSLPGTFGKEQTIYINLNNAGVRETLSKMNTLFSEIIINLQDAGAYTNRYFIHLDQTQMANPEYAEALDNLLNEQFEKFLKSRKSLLPLYAGMEIEQASKAQENSQNAMLSSESISKQMKEVISMVGHAFNIPTSVMLGTYEENDLDDFLTFGIDPIAKMIQESINGNFYGEKAYLEGTYVFVDTKKVKHFDILTVANAINKLISSGLYTINDLREKIDEKPIDDEIGNKHFITRNYAVIGEYISDATNYTDYKKEKTKKKE